ncbi:hypothetical protein ACWENQ_08595 [Nonomuraea sp. NPDC004354]
MIVLAITALLGLAVLTGFVTIVVSIHRDDKAMSLGHAPKSAFARRVTGFHAEKGVSWT